MLQVQKMRAKPVCKLPHMAVLYPAGASPVLGLCRNLVLLPKTTAGSSSLLATRHSLSSAFSYWIFFFSSVTVGIKCTRDRILCLDSDVY